MTRGRDRTPTFWTGDPPPMLPRGQLELPTPPARPRFILERGTETHWGRADLVDASATVPGVYWISTPSHGGFYVTVEAADAMPAGLRRIGVHVHGGAFLAFEEDCAANAVLVAFPVLAHVGRTGEEADKVNRRAAQFVREWYPEHADGRQGCGQLGESSGEFHRCRR